MVALTNLIFASTIRFFDPIGTIFPASVISSVFNRVPIDGTGLPAMMMSVPVSKTPLLFLSYSTGSPKVYCEANVTFASQRPFALRSSNLINVSNFSEVPGTGAVDPASQGSPMFAVRTVPACGIAPRTVYSPKSYTELLLSSYTIGSEESHTPLPFVSKYLSFESMVNVDPADRGGPRIIGSPASKTPFPFVSYAMVSPGTQVVFVPVLKYLIFGSVLRVLPTFGEAPAITGSPSPLVTPVNGGSDGPEIMVSAS